MNQDALKRRAAQAAMDYINDGDIVGVGTGSTVNHFIELLAQEADRIGGAVSSSDASTALLKRHGIEVMELNFTGPIPIYIDGADETNRHRQLIKGGGGALTREKIVAQAAEQFICIVDESKVVDVLGEFPLPIEVIPMARSLVGRSLAGLGGTPYLREDFVTDNGNLILDVYNLDFMNAADLECKVNDIPGVVTCGIFAKRPADVVIVAAEDGITKMVAAK